MFFRLLCLFLIFFIFPFQVGSDNSQFFLTKQEIKNIFEMKYSDWKLMVNKSILKGNSIKVGNDNPSLKFTPMYLDTENEFIMITPVYLSEEKPILITLEISYKSNKIDLNEFEEVFQLAKDELSNDYVVQGSFLKNGVKFPMMLFDINYKNN